MRKPACSIMALMTPVRLLTVASGLRIENELANLEDQNQNREIINQIERLNSQNAKAYPARHHRQRDRVKPHVQLRRPDGPGAQTIAFEDLAQLNDLAFIADSVCGESADTGWINL